MAVRVAYNWRDEFLSGRFDGAGPNPNYTEAYGQFDVNVSYQLSDSLTLQAEASTSPTRSSASTAAPTARSLFATQTGPRYMVGARYKF